MSFSLDCFTCHSINLVEFESEKPELIPKTQLEANLFNFVCDTCLDKRVTFIKSCCQPPKGKITRIG